jgi:ABC-type lipoprotein export system ATPase subunit
MSPPAVLARRLVKSYGTGPSRVEVLRAIDLEVAAGGRVALLGKSGSGKSTLLNLLAALDVPDSGELLVGGTDLRRLDSAGLARYRLQSVGIVFQAFHLLPGRSARENVEWPLTLAGVARPERKRRAAEALEAVGMGHRLGHRPSELSGGERQRVAVARALIQKPALVLADEPTGNLDTASGAAVMKLIGDHVDRAGGDADPGHARPRTRRGARRPGRGDARRPDRRGRLRCCGATGCTRGSRG